MRRFLVVANQTLGGGHLVAEVRAHLEAGPCSFHILVPATPPRGHSTYSEGEAVVVARERLEAAIDRFRELGADADGEIGDPRPIDAIRDVLRVDDFDAIIVSTLPKGASRWLKMGLPARVEAEFGVPVIHLIGGPEPAQREA